MKKCLAVVAVFALTFIAAACGSSSDSSSSSSSASAAAADTTTPASTAASSSSASLPKGNIGILNILGSSEVTQRWTTTTEEAVKAVGWKSTTIDGKGNPSIWGQALSQFVQSKVDGIVVVGGVQTGPIASQLQAAKAASIPVIATGIHSPDPNHMFSAVYGPPDAEFGTILGNYLVKKLPPKSEWVAEILTADQAANEPNVTIKPILEAAGDKRVGTVDLDIASDLPGQVTKGATNLLAAHPKAKLLMSCCDFTATLTDPALEHAGHGDVIQAVRYDNLSTLALIEKGRPIVTAVANADQGPLTAVGQIVKHKANGAAIDPAAADGVWKFAMVDKSNVPPSGKFYFDLDKLIPDWVAKLKSELGS